MNDERLEVREVPTNDDTLASEILSMLKRSLTRSHKLIFALIIIIFVNNLVWIYAWNLPSEEIEDSYQVEQDAGENGNNNYIGNDGDIINGETDNQKNN